MNLESTLETIQTTLLDIQKKTSMSYVIISDEKHKSVLQQTAAEHGHQIFINDAVLEDVIRTDIREKRNVEKHRWAECLSGLIDYCFDVSDLNSSETKEKIVLHVHSVIADQDDILGFCIYIRDLNYDDDVYRNIQSIAAQVVVSITDSVGE